MSEKFIWIKDTCKQGLVGVNWSKICSSKVGRGLNVKNI